MGSANTGPLDLHSKGGYQRIAEDRHDTNTTTQVSSRSRRRSNSLSQEEAERVNGSVDLEMSNMNGHAVNHDENGSAIHANGWSHKQDGQRPSDDVFDVPEATAGLEDYQTDSKRLGNVAFMRKAAINVTLIVLWYLFSVSISVYNKWMFADEKLNFHFPLFTTSLHMVVQFCLSTLVLLLIPRFRPRHDSIDPHGDDATSSQEPVDPKKPLMTTNFYVTRIAPCATATGLDIGLGNTSLKYVTLTFFTMCKSSTLGFVLGFAIIFRLEKMSWKLAGIIAVMTIGVIMMVAGETAFNALGFVLLMLASFFSGLRWSLTQMLLRRNPATSNPFSSLFFLTPIMFVVLLVLAIPVEGIGNVVAGFDDLASRWGLAKSIGIMLAPGLLAFLMTSSEFALLKRTSVVTLSVCGIFKEVLTIGAGGLFFDDQLTPINISGLMVTILAIAAYNYIRVRKMQRKEVQKAQEYAEEGAPMLHPTQTDATADESQSHPPNRTTDLINQGSRASSESRSTSIPQRFQGTSTGFNHASRATDVQNQ